MPTQAAIRVEKRRRFRKCGSSTLVLISVASCPFVLFLFQLVLGSGKLAQVPDLINDSFLGRGRCFTWCAMLLLSMAQFLSFVLIM